MEELISEFEKVERETAKAFSWDAMSFDDRIAKANQWWELANPGNVMQLVEHIRDLQKEIANLGDES